MVGLRRGRAGALAVAAIAAIAATFALGRVSAGGDGSARTRATSPPSPVTLVKVGGVFIAKTSFELPDDLKPYPYTTPTPAPEPTRIDGTYLRVLSLEDVGGARVGLPIRCLRCIPYRRDAGISTLIFFEGIYFLHHHLSGFRTNGHYEVEGDRLTLFNDPNCPTIRGTYAWRLEENVLLLEVVDDPCAVDAERPLDLASTVWTRVAECHRRLQNLWPGRLGC